MYHYFIVIGATFKYKFQQVFMWVIGLSLLLYSFSNSKFVVFYLIALGILLLYFFISVIGIITGTKDQENEDRFFKIFKHKFFIIFPVPFLLLRIWYPFLQRKWRLKTRFSKADNLKMVKLDSSRAKHQLSKGQNCENECKSKLNHVWKIEGADTYEVFSYPLKQKKYRKCEKCNFLTSKIESIKVVKKMKLGKNGEREIVSNCLNCGHQNIEKIRMDPTDYDPDFYYVEYTDYDNDSNDDNSNGSSYEGGSSYGGGGSSGGGSSSNW